jgi:diguanylate cyclase (GGDEF)-like protein
MNVIKDFLFQLMFIAIPIFSYHTFFREDIKKNRTKKVGMPVLWGVSIIFCMSFPASYGLNHHVDIRIIPLLLGTLYGGYLTGVFLSVVIILYYALHFGMNIGFYNTVLALLCAVPVILCFQKSFERAKKEKRVKIAILLSVYYFIVGISWHTFLNGPSLYFIKVQWIHLPFTMLSTWFLTALSENIKEIRQLRVEVELARFDDLTNTLTRRTFVSQANICLTDYANKKRPISFLIFDVDYFKNINDQYGHSVGDYVLQDLSAKISQILGPKDLFGRYGGDEFAILLPGQGDVESTRFAESIKQVIDGAIIQGSSMHYTLSMGILTVVPDQYTQMETLYISCDKALYEAKKKGRNCFYRIIC